MNKRILLFDLQFLKYTRLHTPFPSTAGVLVAGYHKSIGDKVLLSDTVPNFSMYDTVYIIKDDWDLYYDPEWLRNGNVVLIGKFWPSGLSEWKEEWENYPPDIRPYATWAEGWLKKYPRVKRDRLAHFFHQPILIKNNKRIYQPDIPNALILDYEPHKIDEDYQTLRELNIDSIKFLHPIDISYNTPEALKLLKQKNITGQKTAKIDVHTPQKELSAIITLWKEMKMSRLVRLKSWITASNDEEWDELILHTLQFLEQWREGAGKRIFIEPVDEYSYSYPGMLYFLRRWTGKDMGYAYNSLLDYAIYDTLHSVERIENFLIDPDAEMTRMKKDWRSKKVYHIEEMIECAEKNPQLALAMSKPVKGKGV